MKSPRMLTYDPEIEISDAHRATLFKQRWENWAQHENSCYKAKKNHQEYKTTAKNLFNSDKFVSGLSLKMKEKLVYVFILKYVYRRLARSK